MNGTPVLELRNITKTYPGPPETIAVRDINLSVYKGDFVTVIGPSGSGKSTLLNLIGLLDEPTSGTYFLHEQPMTTLKENPRARARGKHIGFVFQAFHLLEQRTCLENVSLADIYTGNSKVESEKRALAALSSVGLGKRSNSYPSELSGGQRQRVAIARALAANPTVLLCDEPTGNLDSHTSDTIINLFHKLNQQGATIILITHDPTVAACGNRTITILDGVATETMPITSTQPFTS